MFINLPLHAAYVLFPVKLFIQCKAGKLGLVANINLINTQWKCFTSVSDFVKFAIGFSNEVIYRTARREHCTATCR